MKQRRRRLAATERQRRVSEGLRLAWAARKRQQQEQGMSTKKKAKSGPAKPRPAASKSDSTAKRENGQVTKADEYRRTISHDLSEAYRRLGRCQMQLNQCKAEQKAAKGDVEAAQQEVNSLASQLRDVELGQYQLTIFNTNGDPEDSKHADRVAVKPAALAATTTLPDAGAAIPIEELKNFGLSESEIEKVKNCPCHPKTIGEFEEWQRGDELWNTKIRGMKEAGITKLQDAHMALRIQYPIPVSGDDEVSVTIDGGATLKMPKEEVVKTILEDATAKLNGK